MTEVADTGKCAVCKSKILEDKVSCPRCETAHCESCWDGKCSVYGCVSAVSVKAPIGVSPLSPATPDKSLGDALLAVLLALVTTFLGAVGIIEMLNSLDTIEVSPDEVVVSEFNGDIEVIPPGSSYVHHHTAKLYRYKWRGKVDFSIPVVLSCEVPAVVSGSVHYDLPVDEQNILKFHFDSKGETTQGRLVSKIIFNTTHHLSSLQFEDPIALREVIKMDVVKNLSHYGVDLYGWNMNVHPFISKEEALKRWRVKYNVGVIRKQRDEENEEAYRFRMNIRMPVSREPNFARCHIITTGCGK